MRDIIEYFVNRSVTCFGKLGKTKEAIFTSETLERSDFNMILEAVCCLETDDIERKEKIIKVLRET